MPQWAKLLSGVESGVTGYYKGAGPEGTPPAYPAGHSAQPAPSTVSALSPHLLRWGLIGGGVLGGGLLLYLMLKK